MVIDFWVIAIVILHDIPYPHPPTQKPPHKVHCRDEEIWYVSWKREKIAHQLSDSTLVTRVTQNSLDKLNHFITIEVKKGSRLVNLLLNIILLINHEPTIYY